MRSLVEEIEEIIGAQQAAGTDLAGRSRGIDTRETARQVLRHIVERMGDGVPGTRRVELLIVESTTERDTLGLRTPSGGLFGVIRHQLKEAGFKPGDRVVIVPAEEVPHA